MTRAALPHLLAHEPALIVNVSGLTRAFPAPFLAIHSGSKSFVLGFSRALSLELSLVQPTHDVECIGVDVHNVSSNSNSSPSSFFTPTGEVEGKAIIGVVGCGKRVVTAYWPHELMSWVLALMPKSVMDRIMTISLVDMRKRELQIEATKNK